MTLSSYVRLTLAVLAAVGSQSWAQDPLRMIPGEKAGNGGDDCESRFIDIRSDLDRWIAAGHAGGLLLPAGVTIQEYEKKMRQNMALAKISCTTDPVSVFVDGVGAPKTCVNDIDDSGLPRIVCNFARFLATPDFKQYVLVHHEYAGLSGFEVNQSQESDYRISSQLIGYLVDVKKLSDRPGPETRIAYGAGGKEYVFTRDRSVPELGEAWRDPSGLIWGDLVVGKSYPQFSAEAYCEKIGASLPKRGDMLRLREYMGSVPGKREGYKPQVLPNLYYADQNGDQRGYFFWTSTHQRASFYFFFGGLKGEIEAGDSIKYGAFRCVARR